LILPFDYGPPITQNLARECIAYPASPIVGALHIIISN